MANKIMLDLGHDIQDFKYKTWHITNWQQLGKRVTGPEFDTGGWKWFVVIIIFHQRTNEQQTFLINIQKYF